MTSAISSGSGATAGERAAKIDALHKQAGRLRQVVSQAAGGNSASPRASEATKLAQELINIEAQIERLVLENQLVKLTTRGDETDARSDAASSQTHGAAAKKDDSAHGANVPRCYETAAVLGVMVNAVV